MDPSGTTDTRSPSPEAEAEADGSWFCSVCHSLNRPGTPSCYSCRSQSPFAAPAVTNERRRIPAWMGLAAVVLVVALVGLTLGISGRFADRRGAAGTPSQVALVDASASTEPGEPTPTPSASVEPTMTVAPTPTLGPTAPTPPPAVETPLSPDISLPKFPVKISGVSVKYYSITGAAATSLISGVEAKGPKACGVAEAGACFRNAFSWTYTGTINTGTGVCSVTSVTFKAVYTITLPKWSGPSRVPRTLVAWWKPVLNQFVWHESQHLSIARGYEAKYKKAILGGSCDGTAQKAAVNAVAVKLAAVQAAFDKAQGPYLFPPYNG